MCNADARDHRRIAKDGWCAGEVVKESNSGPKKYRRDVDGDFVEEPGIQQLLDGVRAVDANGPHSRSAWQLQRSLDLTGVSSSINGLAHPDFNFGHLPDYFSPLVDVFLSKSRPLIGPPVVNDLHATIGQQ